MNKKQRRIKQKWKTSKLKISKHLRDIIHGYLMSDGYINKNGILYVNQSKKQKQFMLWLESELKPIQSSCLHEQIRIHSKTKTKTVSLRFWTKAVLHGFHHLWYKPYINSQGLVYYRKRLPNSVHCFLNAHSVSVWFAGHGTKTIGSFGAKFEVTSFTVEERLKLKKLFLKKFSIKTVLIQSGKSKKGTAQWALKIPAKEYDKFRKFVCETGLIPTLFPHKLHKKR